MCPDLDSLKVSRYLISAKDRVNRTSWIVYCLMTNALARIDRLEFDFLCHFKRRSNWPDLPANTIAQFYKLGMLIDQNLDELAVLKAKNHRMRFRNDKFRLMVNPSLTCNFRCQYCYQEKEPSGTLAPHTEMLLKYLEDLAGSHSVVELSYYGGEALLHLDWMQRFYDSASKIFARTESNLKMNNSVVTNGYLLTRNKAEQLRDLGVEHVQVTLDGPPRIHDMLRPTLDGKPTFFRTLSNIQDVCDLLSVTVRVNVSKQNSNDLVELLDILVDRKLRNRINIYLGPTEATTRASACFSRDCLEMAEFANLVPSFYRAALQRGFLLDWSPSPKSAFCMADCVDSSIVGPDLGLWKCPHHLGVGELKIGQLGRDPLPSEDALHFRFISWDPFASRRCMECDLLPVCLGGCPDYAVRAVGQPRCEHWKTNLTEVLPWIALEQECALDVMPQSFGCE